MEPAELFKEITPSDRRKRYSPYANIDIVEVSAQPPFDEAQKLLCCPFAHNKYDPKCARQFQTSQYLQNHLKLHMKGEIEGFVSDEMMQSLGITTCPVCKELVSVRNKVHTECKAFHTQETIEPLPKEREENCWIPSLHEVALLANKCTLSKVPKKLKKLWSTVMENVWDNAVQRNDLYGMTLLALAPNAILLSPPRAGKNNRKQAVNFTHKRMVRWLNGDYKSLWLEFQQAATYRKVKPSTMENVKKQLI